MDKALWIRSCSYCNKGEKLIKETLGLPKDHKLKFFSSLNKKGKDELVDYLFDDLVEEV